MRARARGEEVPEGGYVGDYVAELAAEIHGAADDGRSTSSAAAASRDPVERIRDVADALPACRSTSGSRERSLHDEPVGAEPTRSPRAGRAGRSSARPTRSEGALWLRTTELRRRQGPRARALDRRAHLLRLRHRLPARTSASAASSGSIDVLGRRPPRLHAADEGGLRGARRRPRRARAARSCSSCTSSSAAASARRCPSAPASSSRSTSSSTRSASTRRAGSCSRARTTRRSTSTSTSRPARAAENPVYYVQYAHARIASVRRKAGERARRASAGAGGAGASSCTRPSAR